MTKEYWKSAELDNLGKRVIEDYHPVLANIDIKIGFLFVSDLKHNGYPAAGLCRKISLRDRVLGVPDVVIEISLAAWDKHTDDEREKILDHELEHIGVLIKGGKGGEILEWDAENECLLDEGQPKLDLANRPKVKLLKHDFQIGGFFSVMKRHPGESIEFKALNQVVEVAENKYGQTFWAWDRDVSLKGELAKAS